MYLFQFRHRRLSIKDNFNASTELVNFLREITNSGRTEIEDVELELPFSGIYHYFILNPRRSGNNCEL